ncbi:Wzz/FepE/Etk N-terminal domain-containing protein [Vibrio agarivorans]|uniref:Wzz/FepE/Etk N-terminal domain-containing protein n=1 Tax=Vibrio agarivorans TaxID=153622 RepID=A0ABT7XW62_9VIBR|nr:Wzz/FepE/Etk N-terminal domain-containing protein [Vibrio agarivorans]MDN2479985.1 Wzz/FepE/Etk N-terminal domain-containing protein [Vibrio agarivorans]
MSQKETQYPFPPGYYPQPQTNDDEIDLRELFFALWRGKWIIIFTTFIFAVGGVLFALSQPNTYKSQALLTPTQSSASGGLSGSLGSLAAFAGVNVGGGNQSDPKVEALAVLQSRKFIETFIQKHDLLVPLMAIESWNEEADRLTYDSDLYDINAKQWLFDDEGESLEPSLWDAHKAFKDILSVSEDKETGMVTLSIISKSPFIAQTWVTLLVEDINDWMKEKALTEAGSKIEYLQGQINRTQVVELQNMFYSLVEEQYKTQMLAEVEEEFVFKTIDPAVAPEEKDGPKRALICVLATLLGGMLGVAIVLVRFAFRKDDEPEERAQ